MLRLLNDRTIIYNLHNLINSLFVIEEWLGGAGIQKINLQGLLMLLSLRMTPNGPWVLWVSAY